MSHEVLLQVLGQLNVMGSYTDNMQQVTQARI
jgi:hypothetical protein